MIYILRIYIQIQYRSK